MMSYSLWPTSVHAVLRQRRYCKFHSRSTTPWMTGPSQSTTVDNVFIISASVPKSWNRNCSDDRTVTRNHVTERHWINTAANVTAALRSSLKTISVALKYVYNDDDYDERKLPIIWLDVNSLRCHVTITFLCSCGEITPPKKIVFPLCAVDFWCIESTSVDSGSWVWAYQPHENQKYMMTLIKCRP